jgi:3-deoxy-7-phosphoheptulonate synthase
MEKRIHNINVVAKTVLPTPQSVLEDLPANTTVRDTILNRRRALMDILDGRDPRLFAVVGPCSIHDLKAAHEYAERLAGLAAAVDDTILILMRVYFEKPRTTVGWKGLVNDPDMDDSFQVEKGIRTARQLLLDLAGMGLATATEALDPVMPQYLGDLVTWTAIGARTTESQTHREMASGLSTPVGFKNGTDGSLQVAVNALKSAAQPHHFLGITLDGRPTVFRTRGNAYGHIVLRGGDGPNYDAANVARTEQALVAAGLPARIMVDCSHGNSNKDHELQPAVAQACVEQVVRGNRSLVGLMIESHLHAGSQTIGENPAALRYGVSVTDACIDWETTARTLREAADKLRPIISARRTS